MNVLLVDAFITVVFDRDVEPIKITTELNKDTCCHVTSYMKYPVPSALPLKIDK